MVGHPILAMLAKVMVEPQATPKALEPPVICKMRVAEPSPWHLGVVRPPPRAK